MCRAGEPKVEPAGPTEKGKLRRADPPYELVGFECGAKLRNHLLACGQMRFLYI
jgi:hypothetical protein